MPILVSLDRQLSDKSDSLCVNQTGQFPRASQLSRAGGTLKNHVVIIGAGIGGLAAAARLAHAGHAVTVIEAMATPGGKMRQVPSVAGPVDAGPTVLTMRPVFEALFADLGETLEDHLTLAPLPVLARHYWADGATLDLMADTEASAANVATAFGPRAAAEFRSFAARAARLYEAFDAPMMQTAAPSQRVLVATVARRPRLIADMAPHCSLAAMLRGAFSDPRLAQLFARYATYVGGSPYLSPALLALIAHSEARGVWAVTGGMHRLAQTLEALARARGATFLYTTPAHRVEVQGGRASAVVTPQGRIAADAVLFNGDPRALATGLLGPGVTKAVKARPLEARSLSAYVHAFAATVSGPPLAHHTVFFGDDPRAEFAALDQGARPTDATLYLCAQDRGAGAAPGGPERFEIILNGAPAGETPETQEEIRQCQTQVFSRLERFGLTFTPAPGPESLTTPQGFARMFPGSRGSLYGQSPHGLTAGLARPRARTALAGLYLTGGGAHPGAGVPMAVLSARHAAAAITQDLALRSTSRPTATPGGMLTGSATTASAPSRSSGS
ncbi:MAG: phytoene desaturase [Rhodobacterales bacterium]|nr:phytoene desaturase [Rhodobacterales bacterium]NCT11506.1 phytoene desaturase [Rhodobacterales bacterium]